MSDVPGDDIPDYNISDDSPISPIEAVPLSSVSSDSPSSAILSTGITNFFEHILPFLCSMWSSPACPIRE